MNTVMLIVTTLLAVADVWSTDKLIKMGRKEGNPIIRFFQKLAGSDAWVVHLLAWMFLIFFPHATSLEGELIGYYIISTVLVYALVNNLRILAKSKREI